MIGVCTQGYEGKVSQPSWPTHLAEDVVARWTRLNLGALPQRCALCTDHSNAISVSYDTSKVVAGQAMYVPDKVKCTVRYVGLVPTCGITRPTEKSHSKDQRDNRPHGVVQASRRVPPRCFAVVREPCVDPDTTTHNS